MKKTSTKRFLPLLFLVFLLVAGGIFYVKNYVLNQWGKIYSNTDYGFSLQYPKNWTLYETSQLTEGDNNQDLVNIWFGESLTKEVTKKLSKQQLEYIEHYAKMLGKKLSDFPTQQTVMVYVTGKSNMNTMQKIISLKYKGEQSYAKKYGETKIEYKTTDTMVDGVQAKVVTAVVSPKKDPCAPFHDKAIFFEKNNQIYEITFNSCSWDEKTRVQIKNPEEEKIFNDMIASFHFITPVSQTVGWNTYSDPQNRFHFQYPQNLSMKKESSIVKFLDNTTRKEKFELSVVNNPTNTGAEDYWRNTINKGDWYQSNFHRTAFNGYSAFTREEKTVCLSKDANNCQTYTADYGLLIQGKGIIVSFLTPRTITKDAETESIANGEDLNKFYNTMLSTFYFNSN